MRLGTCLLGVAGLGLGLLAVSSTACGGKDSAVFGPSGQDGGVGGASAAGHGGSNNGGSNNGGSSNGGSSNGGSSNGGSSNGGSSNGGSSNGGSSNGGSSNGGSNTGGTGGSSGCTYTDSTDHDGDGWSFATGDCNDCDASVNPGAYDGPAGPGKPGIDDDCDGTADNAVTDCDAALPIDDTNPINGAKTLGLCSTGSPTDTGKDKRWAVTGAKYVKADGTTGMNPASHGLLPTFGPANPQQGAAMLALSSGTARAPNQPGYKAPDQANMNTQSAAPTGFPKPSSYCPTSAPAEIDDPAALELEIRVPTNANGLAFDFLFYSYEFPDYVCSQFNDQFIALLNPKPPSLADGNLAHDTAGNAISINIDLLQVCAPQTPADAGLAYTCPLGTALLTGTGFESHSATGWLHSQAPVTPGSTITLRFAIWDAGDHILDSTVLLDKFEWLADAVAPTTVPVSGPK